MKLQKPNKWNKTIKNRIWNGSILAAFIAAAAVFAVMLQTENKRRGINGKQHTL